MGCFTIGRRTRAIGVLTVLLCASSAAWSRDYYAAPTGTSAGDGSLRSPWDLTTAFKKSSVIHAGDTLWLRGGTYRQPGPYAWWPNIHGSPSAPVVIRHYPGEWAALDLGNYASSFLLDNPGRAGNPGNDASYVWLWGLEIFCSDCYRTTSLLGNKGMSADFEIHAVGVKVINCYIHDLSDGISFWQDATNGEAYGNIVLDVGYNAPDRPHGHGGYIQNSANGTKTLDSNFMGDAFAAGLQEYGSAAAVQNMTSVNNVLFDNGAPVGSNAIQFVLGNGGVKTNMVVSGNISYTSPRYGPAWFEVGWQWDGPNLDAQITNNFIWGPEFQVYHWAKATITGNQVYPQAATTFPVAYYALYDCKSYVPCSSATVQNISNWTIGHNTYGSGKFTFAVTGLNANLAATNTGGTSTTSPSVWSGLLNGGDANSTFGAHVPDTVFVQPNKYEPGRANITIVNPSELPSVWVDLSSAGLQEGDSFEIFDVQNFRGPVVASGTFHAASPRTAIPMSGLTRKYILGWSSTPAHTAPSFGTFVLLGGNALLGSAPVQSPADTQPPSVSITSPLANATVSAAVTVVASATDNVGIAGVQFYVDGSKLGGEVLAPPYSIVWNTSLVANGTHKLSAVARDAAGNRTTSAVAPVVVQNAAPDTAPPTVAFTAPVAGQTVSGTINLTVTATDNVGVAGVQYKVDGLNVGTELTSPPYSITWNTASVANGVHTLSVTARDASANANGASISIIVSNTSTPVAQSPMPPPDGYWSFDAAAIRGPYALDTSGNGMNAMIYSARTTPGRVKEALAFGGSAYLVAYNAPKTQLTSDLTLSAWIKTTNSIRREAILAKYAAAGNEAGYLLTVTASGTLKLRIGAANSPTGVSEIEEPVKVNNGVWRHVAVVISLGHGVDFYVDGSLAFSQALAIQPAPNGAYFEVGGLSFTYYAQDFTGAIDEVKIFNSALTAAEVAALASGQ